MEPFADKAKRAVVVVFSRSTLSIVFSDCWNITAIGFVVSALETKLLSAAALERETGLEVGKIRL
jgi:hypothetical protein